MTERAVFGLELQRARERSGLSLDQMAACTKISASLFAGLERGDLSRWPAGIFRRAFVRSYAQAVGLDPEETVARFLRVHPDAEDEGKATTASAPAEPPAEAPALRLVLDQEPPAAAPSPASRSLRRVSAPLLDLALAGIPALVAAFLFGWPWFWIVAGVIGLVGHLLLFSLSGTTPGGWLLLPGEDRRARAAELPALPRRRPEPETTSTVAARRRQTRHSAGPRPVAARSRRVQH